MGKKFKVLLLCLIIGVTAAVMTGCGQDKNENPSVAIQSASEKKFNKIVVQIDGKDQIVEGFNGENISQNVSSGFNLPEKDSVKVKVTLKQKGKTIATSDELELNLKKKKVYMLQIKDVSNDKVELVEKEN